MIHKTLFKTENVKNAKVIYPITGVEIDDFSMESFHKKFFIINMCRYNSERVFERYFLWNLHLFIAKKYS